MLTNLPIPCDWRHHIYLPWVKTPIYQCLKCLMSAFNQEKTLVGAFSMIVKSSRTFAWSSSKDRHETWDGEHYVNGSALAPLYPRPVTCKILFPSGIKATLLQIIDAQVALSGGHPGHYLGGVKYSECSDFNVILCYNRWTSSWWKCKL